MENEAASIFSKELDPQAQRKAINALIITFQQSDSNIPSDLDEKEWDMVERTESMTHLRNTLRHNLFFQIGFSF